MNVRFWSDVTYFNEAEVIEHCGLYRPSFICPFCLRRHYGLDVLYIIVYYGRTAFQCQDSHLCFCRSRDIFLARHAFFSFS